MQSLLAPLPSLAGICVAGFPWDPFFLASLFFFWLYRPPKKGVTLRLTLQFPRSTNSSLFGALGT